MLKYEFALINAAGVIVPTKKVYWWCSGGHKVGKTPIILIADSLLNKKPSQISLNIKNKFKKTHNAKNVTGLIKGKKQPDSLIVFTAHYDHLGVMGKQNIFRGANDNASGAAMVLSLVKYFSKPENLPDKSIAFLFFAGEECGLIGSDHFVNNPTINLKNINALINLDMVGTGGDGLSIVNGSLNPKITQAIQTISNNNAYFSDIRIGGESCNSDHCPFQKKGVPSVFLFTRGKEFEEYHNLKDVPEKLPMTKFFELQKLLIEFAETY